MVCNRLSRLGGVVEDAILIKTPVQQIPQRPPGQFRSDAAYMAPQVMHHRAPPMPDRVRAAAAPAQASATRHGTVARQGYWRLLNQAIAGAVDAVADEMKETANVIRERGVVRAVGGVTAEAVVNGLTTIGGAVEDAVLGYSQPQRPPGHFRQEHIKPRHEMQPNGSTQRAQHFHMTPQGPVIWAHNTNVMHCGSHHVPQPQCLRQGLQTEVPEAAVVRPPAAVQVADTPLAAESTAQSTTQSATQSMAQSSSELVLGSPEMPSRGSAFHHLLACKPCAFVARGTCTSNVECEFCHLCEPGERKRRRKAWLKTKRETEAQQAESKVPDATPSPQTATRQLSPRAGATGGGPPQQTRKEKGQHSGKR